MYIHQVTLNHDGSQKDTFMWPPFLAPRVLRFSDTGDPEPRDLTIRHPPAVHAYADRGWTALWSCPWSQNVK